MENHQVCHNKHVQQDVTRRQRQNEKFAKQTLISLVCSMVHACTQIKGLLASFQVIEAYV